MSRIAVPFLLALALLVLLALSACGSGRPDNELSAEAAGDAPPASEVSIVRPGDPTPEPAPGAPAAAPAPEESRVAPPASDPRSEAQKAADAAVEAARAEVEQAESDLEARRRALAKAEAAAVRASAEPVDDAVVFREVQRLLLEDPGLGHVAIAAEVKGGVVTLRGAVPDASTAEAAIEVASAVEGVQAVRSELRLVE